jgi:hypothetical protein
MTTKKTISFTTIILIAFAAAIPALAQRGNGNGNGHNAADVDAHSMDKGKDKTDFASKIADDPKLSAKLQRLLPPNESLTQASAGFKNEGQFIAALHVSHNLNLSFDQLKEKMTGPKVMSLGASIKALRPNLSEAESKTEAKRAEKEAKETQKN